VVRSERCWHDAVAQRPHVNALGLSAVQVKFNVNRADNMIIQAIAILDQLDKDLNTFAMRVRYATDAA